MIYSFNDSMLWRKSMRIISGILALTFIATSIGIFIAENNHHDVPGGIGVGIFVLILGFIFAFLTVYSKK
jgi:hypothetical protein